MRAIQHLQIQSINPKIKVADLLRTALLIATKLNTIDFKTWITNELNGYTKKSSLPSYRFVNGTCKYYNPYNGLQDFVTNVPEILKLTNNIPIFEKIVAIESLSKNEFVEKELPVKIQYQLANKFYGLKPFILIDNQQIISILDSVKTSILNWTLELEQKGILGDDMTFNEQEKKQAQGISVINIVNSSNNAPIQQGNNNFIQMDTIKNNIETARFLLDDIKKNVDKFNEQDKIELQTDIETAEIQLNSPKPKLNILKTIFDSIKNIFEGAIGSYLASTPQVIEILNKLKDFLTL